MTTAVSRLSNVYETTDILFSSMTADFEYTVLQESEYVIVRTTNP